MRTPNSAKACLASGDITGAGFVDKTDGNYLVIFALPTVFHQDERYYALGKGSICEASSSMPPHASSSLRTIMDTPASMLPNCLAGASRKAISLAYYPSKTRTLEAIASKYGYAIGRDALTNIFREFWPDIAAHVLHRHP